MLFNGFIECLYFSILLHDFHIFIHCFIRNCTIKTHFAKDLQEDMSSNQDRTRRARQREAENRVAVLMSSIDQVKYMKVDVETVAQLSLILAVFGSYVHHYRRRKGQLDYAFVDGHLSQPSSS